MPADYYVYAVFRLTGVPCYVGKGRGGRWKAHIKHSHNPHLQRIYAKANGDLPVAKVRDGLTNVEACMIEQALIAAIGRGTNGPLVNKTDGGEGAAGRLVSADVREATRSKLVGRKHTPERLANIRKGREAIVYTEEWKDNCRAASKRRIGKPHVKHTEDTKRYLSEIQKGKVLTEEHKRKISLGMTGIIRSAEARAANSASRLGVKKSPQVRENMSASRLAWYAANPGQRRGPRSPETKEKLRAASLAYYAAKRAQQAD